VRALRERDLSGRRFRAELLPSTRVDCDDCVLVTVWSKLTGPLASR
jgi:hypothetical protein